MLTRAVPRRLVVALLVVLVPLSADARRVNPRDGTFVSPPFPNNGFISVAVASGAIAGAQMRVTFSDSAEAACRPDLPGPNDGGGLVDVVLSLGTPVPVATDGAFSITLSEPAIGRTTEIAGRFRTKRKVKGTAVVNWNGCTTTRFSWRARYRRSFS